MADEKQPSFLEKFNMSPGQLWANHKVFLIVFGLLILVVKFREVIFDMLVSGSKKQVEEAQKKSNSLQVEQNSANNQANQLIEDAKKLGENRPTVDEDWHKK